MLQILVEGQAAITTDVITSAANVAMLTMGDWVMTLPARRSTSTTRIWSLKPVGSHSGQPESALANTERNMARQLVTMLTEMQPKLSFQVTYSGLTDTTRYYGPDKESAEFDELLRRLDVVLDELGTVRFQSKSFYDSRVSSKVTARLRKLARARGIEWRELKE